MQHIGFWKRTLAYLIDITPIVIGVGAIFYFFFGFDEAIHARFTRTDDFDARVRFLKLRNWVRDLSFLVWLGYCLVMEPSPLQGTLGKRIVGIKVVDRDGRRLSFPRALAHTSTKLASYVALGIGFLWIAFTKSKQGWHDKAARTFVVSRHVANNELNPTYEPVSGGSI